MNLLLWSFIFSGVHFERSGKCCTGTRNWISEYFFWTISYTQTNMLTSESETNACYCAFIFQRDHLKVAQQFFQLVGGSASECGTLNRSLIKMVLKSNTVWACVYNFFLLIDTIPGRQCMASCFFLLRQFEDVLIYLNSVKVSLAQYKAHITWYIPVRNHSDMTLL